MALLAGYIVRDERWCFISSFFLFSLEPEPVGSMLLTYWVDGPKRIHRHT